MTSSLSKSWWYLHFYTAIWYEGGNIPNPVFADKDAQIWDKTCTDFQHLLHNTKVLSQDLTSEIITYDLTWLQIK